jgi:hypothetical protein
MNVEMFATPLINDPAIHRRFIRKAGALYGVIVAVGFALFFWLPDALMLREAHYQGWWVKLVLGLLVTIPMSAVIGWLAASMRWSGLGLLVWIVGGSLLAWIGGHIQYEGVSWLARLTDIYPSERVMYAFSPSAAAFTGIGMVVGAGVGLFVGMIGLVAVERAWDASTARYGFSLKSIMMLALCLPVLLVLGLLADFQINVSTRSAIMGVQQLIETVRDPNADLVRAKLSPMARYRADLSPNYTLYWNSTDDELTHYAIDVQFDTGLVLRCPYILDNAYLCSDLSKQLNEWMTALTTVKDGAACTGCGLVIDATVRQWLNATVPTLGKLESVALLNHHGGWLYMRAIFDNGRKIDCRFIGSQPTIVDLCAEAK